MRQLSFRSSQLKTHGSGQPAIPLCSQTSVRTTSVQYALASTLPHLRLLQRILLWQPQRLQEPKVPPQWVRSALLSHMRPWANEVLGPTQTGIISSCQQYHTVQSGDSCAAIQGIFAISFAALYKWNPSSRYPSSTEKSSMRLRSHTS